ncbi:MAG TPA: lysylphosphatidylglycerol synthase transmembrane domain-containing protein [Chthoniobacterales bacterium]
MKKWLIFSLQALVSIALLTWLFWRQDIRNQAMQVLTSAHAGWLILGWLVAGIGNFLGAVRWGIFLRVNTIPLRSWEVFRLSFIGLFFNHFLLGAVGGDVVKIVWLVAKGYPRHNAVLSAVMDRVSGVGALVVCSTTFMLLRIDWLTQSAVVAHVIHFVFVYLGVIAGLLALSFVMASRGFVDRLPRWAPARAQIVDFTSAYYQFVAAWPRTVAAALISVLMLIAHFVTFYCAARGFGVAVPLLDFMALMPAVDIISALPVSLGGFGVRETTLVTLLGDLCGVAQAQATAVGLGGALLNMAWGIGGALLLPSYRREARTAIA